MPGFRIDARADGAGENSKPYLELYHSEDVPASMIQKTVVKGIEEYKTKVYAVPDEVGKVKDYRVRAVPTTIAKDKDYEIKRWEGPTHADNICDVLDAW